MKDKSLYIELRLREQFALVYRVHVAGEDARGIDQLLAIPQQAVKNTTRLPY